jgi:redox-sensitive bicupin YhaK (pirin superfamily)
MTGSVVLTVGPRHRDLMGLTVNRVWPTARRRLIGPFVFFDHLLHASLSPGVGLDVPPHPHIGLATVTYLFDGEIMHADSMGVRQPIRPGELNWMHAGAGVTHSERSTEQERSAQTTVHGTQAWVALPSDAESSEPYFAHHSADELPGFERSGVAMKLIAGAAFGFEAPVATLSPLFYLEADFANGARLELPVELGQRSAYVIAGAVRVDGNEYAEGQMLVFDDLSAVEVEAMVPSKLMLLGGEPLTGDRFVWWNFVASSEDRIEAAKERWASKQFPEVPGDADYMPMPSA